MEFNFFKATKQKQGSVNFTELELDVDTIVEVKPFKFDPEFIDEENPIVSLKYTKVGDKSKSSIENFRLSNDISRDIFTTTMRAVHGAIDEGEDLLPLLLQLEDLPGYMHITRENGKEYTDKKTGEIKHYSKFTKRYALTDKEFDSLVTKEVTVAPYPTETPADEDADEDFEF